MMDINRIIFYLKPLAQSNGGWTVWGSCFIEEDAYENLVWTSSETKPTKEEILAGAATLKKQDGDTKYQRDRKIEYDKRGCTIEAMNVAIWERLVENRPESSDALQIIREDVKREIPKPR